MKSYKFTIGKGKKHFGGTLPQTKKQYTGQTKK